MFAAWGGKKEKEEKKKKKRKKPKCEVPGTNKKIDKFQGLTFHVLY